ncbi:MAG: hypothetical protein FJW20_13685 [Acidimicrobiia bacterium]|nr:hypothetical protein [Acidimicrobiia bacterium]
MRYLGWALCVSSLAGPVFGQGFKLFEKAPPHVDKALRDRIAHFYQSHVDGKFRLADEAVHEDSKDVFFGAEKTRFRSYKIVSIQYEDNFTKAKVVVECDMDFFMPGIGTTVVHRPISSLWKQEESQWWWYVIPYDPKVGRETPFGHMKETAGGSGPPPGDLMSMLNAAPKGPELQKRVSADKESIDLSSTEPSSGEILITNRFDGPVNLELHAPEYLGLEVKLDKTKLGVGEHAKLTARYTPHNQAWKPEMDALVRVEPLGAVIPVKIRFQLPPAPKP